MKKIIKKYLKLESERAKKGKPSIISYVALIVSITSLIIYRILK